MTYVTILHSKTYAKYKYEGVGFTAVQHKSTKGEKLRNQFVGAIYCTKRGAINLTTNGVPPPSMAEEQLESHLMEGVMTQKYGNSTAQRKQRNYLETRLMQLSRKS